MGSAATRRQVVPELLKAGQVGAVGGAGLHPTQGVARLAAAVPDTVDDINPALP